jgi:hypothetical protein
MSALAVICVTHVGDVMDGTWMLESGWGLRIGKSGFRSFGQRERPAVLAGPDCLEFDYSRVMVSSITAFPFLSTVITR